MPAQLDQRSARVSGIAGAIGLSVALALLVLAAAAAFAESAELSAANGWVEHTHEVIEALLAERSGLAETAAARAALPAGGAGTLPRLLDALARVGTNAQAVRRLTADNRGQQRRLDDLEGLVRQHVALLAPGRGPCASTA